MQRNMQRRQQRRQQCNISAHYRTDFTHPGELVGAARDILAVVQFCTTVPQLPRSLLNPSGSHKGVEGENIDRHGLQFIAVHQGYGGFPYDWEHDSDDNLLSRNHPDVLRKVNENPNGRVKIVEVPKCLLPFIRIREYDGAETLYPDTTAMERDIALEEVKELKAKLASAELDLSRLRMDEGPSDSWLTTDDSEEVPPNIINWGPPPSRQGAPRRR